MSKLINKNIKAYYLLFSPILINFIFNLINKDISLFGYNYLNLISTIFLFLFLFSIGRWIDHTINLGSISLGIIVYFFSFYLIDIIILFFNQTLDFGQIFIITNILWALFLAAKGRNMISLVLTALSYASLNLFNRVYFYKFDINTQLIDDVAAVHFPQAKNIYENSYYFSINNPIFEGYPQFLSYISSLMYKVSFNFETYDFLSPTANIFYFLSILFFFELNINIKLRNLLIFVFSVLILNSPWLQFLFFNSLMGEACGSYFFVVILYNLFRHKENKIISNNLIFFLFGMLFFTKQFFSTLVIILSFLLMFNKDTRKYALFGFSGILLRKIKYKFIFPNLNEDHHLDQIDLLDTFKDLLTFSDLKLTNIIKISQNFFIDKPTSYIFLLLFFIILFSIYKKVNFSFEVSIYLFTIFANSMLVFLLYISAWKDMELESPVRFLLNLLPLVLVTIFILLEENNKQHIDTY